ncbi:hypothetical protein PI20285_05735 [Pediococcus inopinatus]|uniref:type IV toxin-antitoxin system AbiEi family antitoxin domain-containing protein n=1 Tax=Pediococcus TaxID=1253 RepID=UPI00070DBDDC|nr:MULTISPECIES: type IV toxin-antitoxin system AbiEi family antitoxin domain-containing protein [Pediococcus]AVL00180.1 hypothetical protein PI20285_05735 [Pediococcus inopinatus]KRN61809.1 hypothetical protein IV83_GL000514 [Pediococcus inopinatus]PIO80356.1 hypothetical protein BSQ38_01095 [Pediococcus damnosus]
MLKKFDGIFTTKQANDFGVKNSSLKYYVKKKQLDQPMRGIFSDPDQLEDPYLLWQRKLPKGVFGGETGLYLYGLTTNTPYKFHMYFKQGYHFNIQFYDQIIPHYVASEKFNHNVIWHNTPSGNSVKIYEPERCLVDIWRGGASRYTALETLKEYLNSDLINLEKMNELMTEYGGKKAVLELQAAMEALYGE